MKKQKISIKQLEQMQKKISKEKYVKLLSTIDIKEIMKEFSMMPQVHRKSSLKKSQEFYRALLQIKQ